jgi:hypothetical protein
MISGNLVWQDVENGILKRLQAVAKDMPNEPSGVAMCM